MRSIVLTVLLGIAVGASALTASWFPRVVPYAQARSRSAVARPCALDNSPGPSTFAEHKAGRVIAITSIGSWGTTPCRLRERMTFLVKRATRLVSEQGAVRSIKQRPATVTINLLLKPGRVALMGWQWQNWCGRSASFQLQADWGGALAPSRATTPPACHAVRAPSTLTLIPVHLSTCSRSAYSIAASQGQPYRYWMIQEATISLRAHRSPCLLRDAQVGFALQRQTPFGWATMREISGNPAHRALGAVLAPGQASYLFWAWTNWWGGPGTFRAAVQVAQRTSTAPVSRTASCESKTSPSTLTPSYGYGF
jgi:hypothetical protein